MLRAFALAILFLFALLWTMAASTATRSDLASIQKNIQAASDIGVVVTTAVPTGSLITVTTTIDELNTDGDCSLREAIQAAALDAVVDTCPAGSGGDTVVLPQGSYVLTSGQLTLTDTITVQGSITGTTILDGNRQSRVLYIAPDTMARLLYLDIRKGQGPRQDPYVGNEPYQRGEGGGIANYGTTWIAHSAIYDNRAGSQGNVHGGSGSPGGGIFNGGVLVVTNSTISANVGGTGSSGYSHGGRTACGPGGDGGGIANFGTLTLDNVTVTNNVPGERLCWQYPHLVIGEVGGIYSSDNATTNIRNSISAGNRLSDCRGVMTSLGHNVIRKSEGCTVTGDFTDWIAYLEPLGENGGPTLTHALGTKSPAIDAGACTDTSGMVVSVDQRGSPRPQGDLCDIGAYESPYTSTFAITKTVLPRIAFYPSPCTIINPACNLTNDLLHDTMPAWSPDGNKIAFVRSEAEYPPGYPPSASAIYVMNADGNYPIQVSNHGVYPRWSPDGTQILFSSYQGNNWELYVMDADGGNARSLTATYAIYVGVPLWSPDGSRILYMSASGITYVTYVMNADGSQKTMLATDGYPSASPWSPDSSKILFGSIQLQRVHVISVDGTNRVDIPRLDETWGWASNPTWSPDGSQLAYECGPATDTSPEGQFCTANSDGSNRRVLNVSGMTVRSPKWSPVDNKIAFLCTIGGSGSDVCVMKSDGTQVQNLSLDRIYPTRDFYWSPDGSKLLFQRAYGGYTDSELYEAIYELMVVNMDGSNMRRLTYTPDFVYIGEPVWSPDSRKIVYVSGVDGDREIYVLGVD